MRLWKQSMKKWSRNSSKFQKTLKLKLIKKWPISKIRFFLKSIFCVLWSKVWNLKLTKKTQELIISKNFKVITNHREKSISSSLKMKQIQDQTEDNHCLIEMLNTWKNNRFWSTTWKNLSLILSRKSFFSQISFKNSKKSTKMKNKNMRIKLAD